MKTIFFAKYIILFSIFSISFQCENNESLKNENHQNHYKNTIELIQQNQRMIQQRIEKMEAKLDSHESKLNSLNESIRISIIKEKVLHNLSQLFPGWRIADRQDFSEIMEEKIISTLNHLKN